MWLKQEKKKYFSFLINLRKVDTSPWAGRHAPLRAHGPQWQPFWLLAESCFHWGFIRHEQVTDSSVKRAVVKTQASNGEKSIRVEALGRKGGTKAHPDIAGTHDWCVCAHSHTCDSWPLGWAETDGHRITGWKNDNRLQWLHCEANLAWFVSMEISLQEIQVWTETEL